MKKRKSPIVLVTILAVMASVSFGLQYAWSKSSGPGTEAPPQMPDVKQVGEARPAESQAGVGAGIKSAMNGKAGGAPTPMSADGPPGRPGMPGAGGPMILNPSRPPTGKPEKPKPNSSSTSAQWYEKESAIGSGKTN